MKKFLLSILFASFAVLSMAQDFPKERFETADGYVDIWCVNHGSVVISTADYDIFVDPVMHYYGKEISYDGFLKAADRQRLILICHEHGDHLDKEAVKKIANANTEIIGNKASIKELGMGRSLRNRDFTSVNFEKIPIVLHAVPAYNTTKAHKKFHPKGHGNGYIVKIGDFKILVAGDTEDIPEYKNFLDIDVALLPVNQPYTMTPEQCVHAAKVLKPKVLIPYHLGDTDTAPIVSGLAGSDIEVRLHEELR